MFPGFYCDWVFVVAKDRFLTSVYSPAECGHSVAISMLPNSLVIRLSQFGLSSSAPLWTHSADLIMKHPSGQFPCGVCCLAGYESTYIVSDCVFYTGVRFVRISVEFRGLCIRVPVGLLLILRLRSLRAFLRCRIWHHACSHPVRASPQPPEWLSVYTLESFLYGIQIGSYYRLCPIPSGAFFTFVFRQPPCSTSSGGFAVPFMFHACSADLFGDVVRARTVWHYTRPFFVHCIRVPEVLAFVSGLPRWCIVTPAWEVFQCALVFRVRTSEFCREVPILWFLSVSASFVSCFFHYYALRRVCWDDFSWAS